ncbi:MAG: 50S ribosomal protein L25 [Epsilonproteobacteria bacterium]|nr:MAG: 50S ribosomal protein L25 [Campylobacterota bacterium]RLA67320.1 MAG: 50S ribosomal protein L25 [Campylobacterota bacterium]
MEDITVQKRDINATKAEEKKVQGEGFVKGVICGKDFPSISIFVNIRKKHIHQGSIFSMKLGRKNLTVTANQIQRDPVKRNITHVSFLNVAKGEKTTVEVPLSIVGELTGEGAIQSLRDSVQVNGALSDIPESLTLDISDLDINETLCLSDIELPSGLSWQEDDLDQVVAKCNPPQLEIVEEPVVEEVETAEEAEEETVKKAG